MFTISSFYNFTMVFLLRNNMIATPEDQFTYLKILNQLAADIGNCDSGQSRTGKHFEWTWATPSTFEAFGRNEHVHIPLALTASYSCNAFQHGLFQLPLDLRFPIVNDIHTCAPYEFVLTMRHHVQRELAHVLPHLFHMQKA